MGNTILRTNLASPGQGAGQVNNDVDGMYQTLAALVKQYIPGLPPLKGIRSFAVDDDDKAPIPCCMIQSLNLSPTMATTARFEKWYAFDFWYAVGGETVEEVEKMVEDGGVLFVKLFSNNALNDRGANPPSNKFCSNGTAWIFSKMTAVDFSPAIRSGRTPGPKYFALGKFQLRLQTVPALA